MENKTIVEQPKDEFLETAKANFTKFCEISHQNAERIRMQFSRLSGPDYAKGDFNIFNLSQILFGAEQLITRSDKQEFERLLVTDQPEEIFGTEPVYHVTSSAILQSLKGGSDIFPPLLHHRERVQSHRGIGLELWSRFGEFLGLDVANKDDFVWTGRKVDQEQLLIDDNLAKNKKNLDEEILKLFFGKNLQEDFISENVVLNPTLFRVLKMIEAGEKPADDPELKAFVEDFCRKAFFLFGIRDGWYLDMKAKLLGETKIDNISPSFTDDISLDLDIGSTFAQKYSGFHEAVILKIDPRKIFQEHELYPFPMTYRNPNLIVPFPNISSDAITDVYVRTPEAFDISLVPPGASLHSFDDLPEKDWLGEKYFKDVTFDQIDPENPLCRINYEGRAQDLYRHYFYEGKIIFAKSQHLGFKHTGSFFDCLLGSFGEEILHEDREKVQKMKNNLFFQCAFDQKIDGLII